MGDAHRLAQFFFDSLTGSVSRLLRTAPRSPDSAAAIAAALLRLAAYAARMNGSDRGLFVDCAAKSYDVAEIELGTWGYDG